MTQLIERAFSSSSHIVAAYFLVMIVAAIAFIIIDGSKLIHRYIFDGADSRTPFLVPIYAMFLVELTIKGYMIATQTHVAAFTHFISIVYFSTFFLLVAGRLMCYPFSKVNVRVKNILFAVTSVMYMTIMVFTSTIVEPDHTFEIIRESHSINTIAYSLLMLFKSNTDIAQIASILFFIGGVYATGLSLGLDLYEGRSKRTIIADLLAVYLVMLFAVLDVLSQSFILTHISVVAIPVIFFVSTIFFATFAVIYREFSSVMKHSTQINTLVNACNRSVMNIAKKKKLTKRDKMMIQNIASIAASDKVVRASLERFTLSRSRKHIIREIESEIRSMRRETDDALAQASSSR
jgi:hypothetical protein